MEIREYADEVQGHGSSTAGTALASSSLVVFVAQAMARPAGPALESSR